jgi:hypothetical protein
MFEFRRDRVVVGENRGSACGIQSAAARSQPSNAHGHIAVNGPQHSVVMTFRAERCSASQAGLHAYAVMVNLGGNYPPLQTFQDRLAFRYGQPSGGRRQQILALNCGDLRFRRLPTNAFGNQSYSSSHLSRSSLPTTLHALGFKCSATPEEKPDQTGSNPLSIAARPGGDCLCHLHALPGNILSYLNGFVHRFRKRSPLQADLEDIQFFPSLKVPDVADKQEGIEVTGCWPSQYQGKYALYIWPGR